MKKIDSFFVTILVILVALTGTFYYAYSSLNYFENNSELNAKFERKKSLMALAKKMDNIAKSNKDLNAKRSLASIPINTKGAEALAENSANANELAKRYFLVAKVKCYEINKELECLDAIETGVTHFPESNWTAESLVLLSDFYFRTKRTSLVREVLKILKQDFKSDKSIQLKVSLIERHLN